MWGRGVVGGAMIGTMLGACAVVDPVDNRYDNIGRSLAKARNESIFLNIVRASHDDPLAFTAIGSVTPSMTNTSTIGLPSFLVGPNPRCSALTTVVCVAAAASPGRDVIFGNTNNLTDSLAVSSNFNISTEETSQFYDGFLKPIDLTVLNYFIRQGYSRELLFWMFMDSFEIKSPGGLLGFQFNPPYDYGCPQQEPKHRCFREFIEIATIAGLSVETKTVEVPKRGGGGKTGGGGGGGGGSGGGGNTAEERIYARFCFDSVLQQRATDAMAKTHPDRYALIRSLLDPYQRSPFCGQTWNPQTSASVQTDTLSFRVGPDQFTIQPRSAYSMLEFLGTLIKMQRDQQPDLATQPWVPPSRPDETNPPKLSTVADDENLFTVVRNQEIAGQCFVHTWFIDGDYCVPENAANTKRIFSMLAQLIAIQTQADDLSVTPTVRIIQ